MKAWKMDDKQRDEIARVLEQVAAEGLDHPRNLDAALDVIADTVDPFNRLSPAEAERLAMLAEEAAEVIQVVNKILRHGYDSYNPDRPELGTNRTQLTEEVREFFAVASAMGHEGDFSFRDEAYSDTSERIWNDKQRWTHHQETTHG